MNNTSFLVNVQHDEPVEDWGWGWLGKAGGFHGIGKFRPPPFPWPSEWSDLLSLLSKEERPLKEKALPERSFLRGKNTDEAILGYWPQGWAGPGRFLQTFSELFG